jgi:putative spermidine/putrescine transport system substrate-binding protein
MHAHLKPARRRLAVGIALGLAFTLVAACGDDDDDDAASTETTGAAVDTTEAGSTATTAGGTATTAGGTATTSGDTATTAAGTEPAGTAGEPSGDVAALYEAAQAEGQVNLIALPDSWANYAGILQSFRDKYPGVDNPVANPDASSADELTAVKTLAGQPDMPDALDVGPSFALQAADEGLWAPFQPSTWDEIPATLRDPDGNWVAAYYGIMAIGTNTTLVDEAPQTFADLADPQYAGQVALNGDPREAGAAFAAVMAASLANGGSFDDIMPGIQFFADLKSSGNLSDVQVTEASILSGETPIVLDWTYNFPGLQSQIEEAGFEVDVVVPSDGVYGSYYSQGVVADGPHPNAARLWIEHILSDEGALGYLEGGAIPARYAAMVESGVITDDMLANLPPAELIEQIEFPTDEQLAAAQEALATNWGPMVADA